MHLSLEKSPSCNDYFTDLFFILRFLCQDHCYDCITTLSVLNVVRRESPIEELLKSSKYIPLRAAFFFLFCFVFFKKCFSFFKENILIFPFQVLKSHGSLVYVIVHSRCLPSDALLIAFICWHPSTKYVLCTDVMRLSRALLFEFGQVLCWKRYSPAGVKLTTVHY